MGYKMIRFVYGDGGLFEYWCDELFKIIYLFDFWVMELFDCENVFWVVGGFVKL